MRTIEEFKRDRAEWNRAVEQRHKIRLVIGWLVVIVILVVLAVVGLNYYKQYRAQHQDAKPAESSSPDGSS